MAAVGKSLDLGAAELEEIVDSEYKQKRTFLLLSLLYPGVDTRNEFHVDHVFPKGRFTDAKLRDAGVPGDLIDSYQDAFNRMANLQLLDGSVNVSKQQTLPMEWAKSHFPNAAARAGYFATHDMHDLPDDMDGFLAFYAARRQRMHARLSQLLSASSAGQALPGFAPAETPSPSDVPSPPAVAIGRSPEPALAGVGGRTVFNRSLSNVPDGPIEWHTKKGTHRAVIQNGEIVLGDGRRFYSPSGAADAVAGGSHNGWRVWTRGGKTLAELHP